ncbi:MAG: response regulator [Rhodothermales bacterium]
MSRKDTIIVAEDNDLDFDEICEALQRMDAPYPVARATTGEACIDLLDTLPTAPTLVLLDLNLPGMDGREVLENLRQHRSEALPVVVFTTSTNPTDISACYERGANSYHLKPLEVPAFRETVQTIVRYWMEEAVLPVAP